MTLSTRSAGTSDATKIRHNVVPSPAPTASRKTTQQASFITDKSSKRRFLTNMGSDLCVFPRKLITQRRTRINYDIRAANGITIPTYGWLPLSINPGFHVAICGGQRHTTPYRSRFAPTSAS
jgi:hypothetical protein